MISSLIRLARPEQYIKNLVIFLPIFFSARFGETGLLIDSVFAFIAFSLCASSIYIFNDIQDAAFDIKHPIKKNRPIASGAVPPNSAFLVMGILLITGFSIMLLISFNAAAFLAAYVLLNIAYSMHLKHVAIIDISIIGAGFVLRLLVGAATTMTTLSMWIVIMIYLAALFIALAKRRDDVLVYLDTGKSMRKVIDGYNLTFIDSAMTIFAAVIIVAYILYTTSTEIIGRLNSPHIYLTAIFVILGIMRFLQISFVEKKSGDPVSLFLKDRFLQGALLGWLLSFSFILYY